MTGNERERERSVLFLTVITAVVNKESCQVPYPETLKN